MKATQKKIIQWLPALLLAGLVIYAYISGWHHFLTLESLQEQKLSFQDFAQENPLASAAIFAGGYALAVALSLPIATLLTLLGGFLFGKWLGTALVVSGATAGASIIFLIAKTSLGAALRERAGSFYQKISKNMEENAFNYLLFMRLVPVFPFVLVNIAPALFNVPLRIFVITTFIGIIPGSFVYVNLGEALGEIDSLGDLVSVKTLASFALLGAFALMPVIYKQIKTRKSTTALVIAATIVTLGFPAQAGEYSRFVNLYDGLLNRYTKQSSYNEISYMGVDYSGWGKDERHKKALETLLKTDSGQFNSREQKLAFWINAYNFLTIDLIIRENETGSIKNLGSIFSSLWKKHSWEIAGNNYTLDAIEHNILRPMGDPRIHFAINCASVSCPDLRAEAFRADILDVQLKEQVVLTLDNPRKGYEYSKTNQTVYLSKILDWFEEDFNDGEILSWLDAYKPNDITPAIKVKFLPYDWALNKIRTGDNS